MTKTTRAGAERGDVVVGVDGSPASANAVRYGIEEARRSGSRLRLVHVLPPYAGAHFAIPTAEITSVGRSMLRAALDQVRLVDVDLPVQTVLLHGSAAAALVSDARTAEMVVVGADRRPIMNRVLSGNTTTCAAARSLTPVVAVPENWTPPTSGGVVLVGVKSFYATEQLGEAFAVAHQLGCRLLVLHAWELASGYDAIIVQRVAHDEWEARTRAELAALVARWQMTYPEVEVELRVVYGQAAHALVAASREADMLVVMRKSHGYPAVAHLGSTARTLLREAACPVRVVAQGHASVAPDLNLEIAGAIRK